MVANTSHTEERLPRKGRVRTAVCKFPYVYRVLVFFLSVRVCVHADSRLSVFNWPATTDDKFSTPRPVTMARQTTRQ